MLAGDLNLDGEKDVVFFNKRDGVAPTPAYVYWGDQNGRFDPQRRQELPRGGGSYTASDLDQDGHVDLFLGNCVAKSAKPALPTLDQLVTAPQFLFCRLPVLTLRFAWGMAKYLFECGLQIMPRNRISFFWVKSRFGFCHCALLTPIWLFLLFLHFPLLFGLTKLLLPTYILLGE